MPLLNYTTTIDPLKTIGEIQSILVKHGATNVSIDFADGVPVALTFLVKLNDEFINFRLPSNHTGCYKALCKDLDVPRKFKTTEQARRVAWRIVKDWVEAQMAIIKAELATMPEVFFAYAVLETGQTLYESVSTNRLKLLSGSATTNS